MPRKPKKKLTPEQRRARKRRREETMIVFINGKQKRVPRPAPDIDGFLLRNADPITLNQMERWDLLEPEADSPPARQPSARRTDDDDDGDIPF